MKSERTIALIITFIITIALSQIGWANNISDETKKDSKQNITVKIPDGIYLFESIIDTKSPSFIPLMIIDNGKIINPYKFGKDQFNRSLRHVKSGDILKVFIGDMNIGGFKTIKYQIADATKYCPTTTEIKGEYQASSNMYVNQESNVYARNNITKIKHLNAIKALITPSDYKPLKSPDLYPVTEQDRNYVIDIVKRNSFKAISDLKRRNKSGRFVIKPENKGELQSLLAIDIDGSGKKSFIGIYTFDIDITHREISEESMSCDVLFFLWHSGAYDVLATNWEVFPGLSVGAILDIDQDGVFEIAYQEVFSPEKHLNNPYMKQITILKYDNKRWNVIYKTKKICGEIR